VAPLYRPAEKPPIADGVGDNARAGFTGDYLRAGIHHGSAGQSSCRCPASGMFLSYQRFQLTFVPNDAQAIFKVDHIGPRNNSTHA
jgi:hypothetical protein